MFVCRVSCVPALSVDPDLCRLLYVAGGSSKVEAKSLKELQCRLKSDQDNRFRVDSDLEALCRSALDNLVLERQFTDGQKVLGTQDKETKRSGSR